MARVEAWLFGLGLVVAWLVGARKLRGSRAPLVIGWLLGMGVYAKFLLDQTGNPIYPLYINFQFVGLSAGGTGGQAAGGTVLWLMFGLASTACMAVVAWSLWKRPASYLLLTLGFATAHAGEDSVKNMNATNKTESATFGGGSRSRYLPRP